MSNVQQPHSVEPIVVAPTLGLNSAIQLKHLLIVVGVGAFFLYHNYIPLFHSDLWGHVSYGNWILEQRVLPEYDPFVPLAEGVRLVDTAWLSQVAFALVERWGTAEALSHVFAAIALLTYLGFARLFYRQSGSTGIAFFSALLVWFIAWSRHAVIRPENFGLLCFAALMWLIVSSRQHEPRHPASSGRSDGGFSWGVWIGVPLLFVAWANLHGSFIVGLAMLGCFFAGRFIEALWCQRSFVGALCDRSVRRWLVLSELAVCGTLVNPYGIDLLIQTVLFPANSNLKDLLEWQPLVLMSSAGLQVGLSWLLMTVVLRHSRVRVRPADVLLLAVFTLAVCMRSRMVTWYAPVMVAVLLPHLTDVLNRLTRSLPARSPSILGRLMSRTSISYTAVAAVVIWLSFALAPASQLVLGGTARSAGRLYNRDTPIGVTNHLREHPPMGQIANPQWWGDWLVWNGPPELEVFMTTNAIHVAPRKVWNDYMAIAHGQPGLEQRLERYRINTIVTHKDHQRKLTQKVRGLKGWEVSYEDDMGLVATRMASQGMQSPSSEPPKALHAQADAIDLKSH